MGLIGEELMAACVLDLISNLINQWVLWKA